MWFFILTVCIEEKRGMASAKYNNNDKTIVVNNINPYTLLNTKKC